MSANNKSTKTKLQDSFQEMVQNVVKYKGFLYLSYALPYVVVIKNFKLLKSLLNNEDQLLKQKDKYIKFLSLDEKELSRYLTGLNLNIVVYQNTNAIYPVRFEIKRETVNGLLSLDVSYNLFLPFKLEPDLYNTVLSGIKLIEAKNGSILLHSINTMDINYIKSKAESFFKNAKKILVAYSENSNINYIIK